MLRRLLAFLFTLFGASGILFFLFILRMRRRRRLASEPEQLPNGVVRVRNAFTDMYGARAGDHVVLFDAGFDPEGRALDVLLRALNATRDDVSDVFLSHAHFDHVAAAPLCRRARIHIGAGDVEMLARRSRVEPAGVRLFDYGLAAPAIEATNPLRGHTRVVLPDGSSVVAIPFPGHTAGSYVMLFRGVLFAGDAIRIANEHLECGLLPFTVDSAENRRSAARIMEWLGDRRVDFVCTGHQGCTPAGQAIGLLRELAERSSDAGHVAD
jgi:hydroxyacylglutathione hydrolase